MKRLLFLVILLSSQLSAQYKKKIDSLEKLLPAATDTNRVKVLKSLGYYVRESDPQKGLQYINEAIALASKLHWEEGYFDAVLQKGLTFYEINNADSAIYYLNICRPIAETQHDSAKLFSVYGNLGNVYGEIGQSRTCLSFYMMAMEYAGKRKTPQRYAYTLVNIATVYSVLGQHDSALVFYRTADSVLEKTNPRDENLVVVYNNLGATYINLHDTAKAEIYFRKAQQLAIIVDDKKGQASSENHLSVIAFSKGLQDSAIRTCRRSLNIYRQTQMQNGVTEVCLSLGEMFGEMNQNDSALHYLLLGKNMAEQIQDYYNLTSYYENLAKVFENMKLPDSALFYEKKLVQAKDTVYNLNKSNVVGEMRTTLENEQKQKQIQLLNARDEKKNIIIYSAIAMATLVLLLGIVVLRRYLEKKKGNELLTLQNEEIQHQKEIIEEKNKDITDSIRYAKRIQDAILPSDDHMHSVFAESWCYFLPKDIVSGDFYWFEKEGDSSLFAVVDCTGHGVPGALLSVVGHNFLQKAVHDMKLTMPDKILGFLNEEIYRMLRHKNDHDGINDGMDISLCSYHAPSRTMYFSAAFNPLYVFRKGEFIELKADKIPIGSGNVENKKYSLQSIKAEPGDQFFLFSDGFADQFGGAEGKKLKYKSFRQMLLSVCDQPMEKQAVLLKDAFENWKKGFGQVDDVCIVGVRI